MWITSMFNCHYMCMYIMYVLYYYTCMYIIYFLPDWHHGRISHWRGSITIYYHHVHVHAYTHWTTHLTYLVDESSLYTCSFSNRRVKFACSRAILAAVSFCDQLVWVSLIHFSAQHSYRSKIIIIYVNIWYKSWLCVLRVSVHSKL